MASNISERDLPIPLPSPLQSHPPDFPTTYSRADDADPEPVSPISSILPMSPVPTRPGQGQAAGLRMVSPSPAPTAVSSRPLPALPPLDTSPEATAQEEPPYIANTRHQVEQRIRYLPEWETPRNPPKRGKLQQTRNLLSSIPFLEARKQPSFVKKQHKPRSKSIPSLFSLVDPVGEKDSREATSPNDDQHGGVISAGWRKSLGFGYMGRNSFAGGLDPERHGKGGGGILPTHTVTTLGSIPNPPPPPRLTEKERVRKWVNRRLLPPEKRYPFGLNRRRFCLFFLLPLLLLLLLGLALGLGLGLGLKHHHKDDDSDSDIPLPSPLGEDPPLTVHQATFTSYSPSSRVGACGMDVKTDAMDVAISYKIWDEAAKRDSAKLHPRNLPDGSFDPQWKRNPLCGNIILIRQQGDLQKDEWVQAKVMDRCGPDRCPEVEDLDLTVGAFETVYNITLGGVLPDSDQEDDGGREGWWAWPAE
ncbi:hypothetical protein QBC32DRAFT_107411 [Pseudoneurospora amorphoporcata]|uniref:Uncharacterized protein n=1 Tax=Pseudoneurospora amorphoporcata TaxID=241081 RepID=A0AAN6SB04_9PEZI|nr:hypothetical protein QBC32DRAFT_107411 [Pseudoneurospora amorphoporcata]